MITSQDGAYYNFLDLKHIEILNASNVMDSTLLITGQTGTGKSHLANTVHKSSNRANSGRWFKINLATLSENLIESELFGHERGAFTGADTRRLGKLEIANGGTVFLDEIGELPLRLQSKLLDFIQYKKITPVGSNREIELDVRIIAATNKDLEKEIKGNRFREDLYHRLNVFHVKLHSISKEKVKLNSLAKFILSKKCEKAGKKVYGIAPEVTKAFELYKWPGNIRELENVIEYAVAFEKGDMISVSSLPEPIVTELEYFLLQEEIIEDALPAHSIISEEADNNVREVLEIPFSTDYHIAKDDFEKRYLENALKMFSGQINLTSRMIKLNKVSMTEKLKKHKINWKKIRIDNFGPKLREATKLYN